MTSSVASAAPRERERFSGRRLEIFLVVAACLVATLRFVRLSRWSLWIDEALTWTDWHVGLAGGEIKNPAGYWLVARSVEWFGGVPDEFALRFLPALVGTSTIPLTWLAFRRHVGGLRAAAAALVLAASSWHVYWSQNARFYTFAQFTSLLGAWIYLAGLARGSTVRAVIGLVVAAAAAAFHPSAALLLPVLVLAPFVVRFVGLPLDERARRVAWRCLVGGALVVLAGSKWAYGAWVIYRTQKGTTAYGGEFLPSAVSSVAHASKTIGFYVTPLVFAACAFGAWSAWRRRDRALSLVAVVVTLGLAGGLLTALFVRVSAQYAFYLLPWIVVLACGPLTGGGAERTFAPRDEREPDAADGLSGGAALGFTGILFLPALAGTVLYLTVRQGERPPWRDAYQLAWSQRGPDDLVLGMHAPVGEYYVSPRSRELRLPRQVGVLDYFHARDPETWSRYPRRAWFIVNPEDLLDWDPVDAEVFRRMLREECRLVQVFPLYVESRDLSVWVWVRE